MNALKQAAKAIASKEKLLNAYIEAPKGSVWIYTSGDEIKVFATEEAAQAWFDENDKEGVAWEYPVEGS